MGPPASGMPVLWGSVISSHASGGASVAKLLPRHRRSGEVWEPACSAPVASADADAADASTGSAPGGATPLKEVALRRTIDGPMLDGMSCAACDNLNMASAPQKITLREPGVAGSYEFVERRGDGSLLLRPERERLSDVVRETEGQVFRDEEFAAHLERVAASADDLPADPPAWACRRSSGLLALIASSVGCRASCSKPFSRCSPCSSPRSKRAHPRFPRRFASTAFRGRQACGRSPGREPSAPHALRTHPYPSCLIRHTEAPST